MNSISDSLTGLDRLFLDALVAEEYEAAAGAAVLGGLQIEQARQNHAVAEGYT